MMRWAKMKMVSGLALAVMSVTACTDKETTVDAPPSSQRVSVAPLQPDAIKIAQTLYVPVHSEIHFKDDQYKAALAATLAIRNVDISHSIVVHSVRYYDENGKLIRQYLDQPFRLDPLASTVFVVHKDDLTGGIAPSFIVEWASEFPAQPPLVETVMIDITVNTSVAFVGTSRVIAETINP